MGGAKLSGETHAVRSNSMNSSAFSWGVQISVPATEGKHRVDQGARRGGPTDAGGTRARTVVRRETTLTEARHARQVVCAAVRIFGAGFLDKNRPPRRCNPRRRRSRFPGSSYAPRTTRCSCSRRCHNGNSVSRSTGAPHCTCPCRTCRCCSRCRLPSRTPLERPRCT